jgi:biopolymer transport protein TolR
MKRLKTGKRQGLNEINLTSLVDVSLTLVIIFMASSPFVLQSGILVSTPKLTQAETQEEVTELKAEIDLGTEGAIQINGEPVTVSQFADSLRVLLSMSKEKRVVLSASGEVMHDQVIALMDEAKQCGAKKISLVRRAER